MSYPVRRASRYPRTAGWWDPFAEIEAVHRPLDQLFFGTPSSRWAPEGAGDIDLDETEDGWVVEAQLPGVPAEDIDVDLTDRELSVRGSAGSPGVDGDSQAGKARGRRQYTYRLTLPGEVDGDRVTANLENGLLTVRLPRSPRAAGRKIQVGTGGTADRQTTNAPTSMQEETAPGAGTAWGQRPGSPMPERQPGTDETTGSLPPPVTAGETGMATYQQSAGGVPYQPPEAQGRYPVTGQEVTGQEVTGQEVTGQQQPLPDQPPGYGYENYPAQAEQPYQEQPYQEQPYQEQPYQEQPYQERQYQGWPEQGWPEQGWPEQEQPYQRWPEQTGGDREQRDQLDPRDQRDQPT